MINNFGQTPCQLLKDSHPKRMSLLEYKAARAGARPGLFKPDMFLFFTHWTPSFIEMSSERDPVVYIALPKNQPGGSKSFIGFAGNPDSLVTISQSCMLGVHGWLPYDSKGKVELANTLT